jgi:hypothetical protein
MIELSFATNRTQSIETPLLAALVLFPSLLFNAI